MPQPQQPAQVAPSAPPAIQSVPIPKVQMPAMPTFGQQGQSQGQNGLGQQMAYGMMPAFSQAIADMLFPPKKAAATDYPIPLNVAHPPPKGTTTTSVTQGLDSSVHSQSQTTARQVANAPLTAAQATPTTLEGGMNQDRIPTASQAMVDSSSPQAFVQSLLPVAEQWSLQTGVPPEVLLAINASESGWGTAKGNELFGVENTAGNAGSTTQGTLSGTDLHPGTASFAAYSDPNAAYQGFWDFLTTNSRYDPAMAYLKQTGDWQGWIDKVNQAGYAEDPNWASKIKTLAKQVATMTGQHQTSADNSHEQDQAYLDTLFTPTTKSARMGPPPPSSPLDWIDPMELIPTGKDGQPITQDDYAALVASGAYQPK